MLETGCCHKFGAHFSQSFNVMECELRHLSFSASFTVAHRSVNAAAIASDTKEDMPVTVDGKPFAPLLPPHSLSHALPQAQLA